MSMATAQNPYPSSTVLYLTLITLYLIIFTHWLLARQEREDMGEDSSWLALWEDPPTQKTPSIGVLPEGVIKRKVDRRSSIKRVSSSASRLFKAALNKLSKPTSNTNSKQKLDWEIDISALPKDFNKEILLCFVNSRSGGQEGREVLQILQSLLGDLQAFDLQSSNPVDVLREYSKLPKYKVLVAGGDGSMNWILDSIHTVYRDSDTGNSPPAVCTYPIGTGNDLSNSLGWLSFFSQHRLGVHTISNILHKSSHMRLDRWTASFNCNDDKSTISSSTRMFSNYMGLGIDAQIVLRFHELRY
jgi:diacylglycerol kinase (ATP)